MVLNKEYCFLLGVTVLEVILFQQVFVNLILDVNYFKVMQEYVEHLRLVHLKHEAEIHESKFSEKSAVSTYILNFSSAFNFCLSLIYLLCVYVAMNQTSRGSKNSFTRFCGDFILLTKLVNLWYIFKISFCLLLFLILLVNTSMSFTDSGYLLSLLLASFGNTQ